MKYLLLLGVLSGCMQDVSNECARACDAYAASCGGDTQQCVDRCEADLRAKAGACTVTAASCDADHYVELSCFSL